ncbi:glutamic acid-rich protein-like [Coccinella septempunctata]|uniref:glutamic acid-rich protein-like n=1 Tax=Coccinella septempunctata TaxID=41139 RepID=UPI001D072AED|nr:glutamic acid-rich protein-like [Coccinella septempunctata]XP_044759298.1 glutamic acid-rich protein-like [Coccinella septempunctata]XP_044759299.1 glutamic acid-rich protein-like [Coccinella septempunctata]
MSKSAKTSEHEETDENVLFDDGFSVVDDTGIGSVEGDQEKTNDEKKEEVVSNIKKDIAKKPVKDHKDSESSINKIDIEDNSEVKTESSKSCGDSSTLILSNDVDLGTEVPVTVHTKVKVEKVSEEPKVGETNQKETKLGSSTDEKNTNATVIKKLQRKKGTSSSFVWIANISSSVNASSLKKHFSDCGRVNTAKVVTNGKLFFGYVEFDTPKIALECVEKMNNTVLAGKKILVSRSRPDVTKKGPNGQKKPVKNDQQLVKHNDATQKKKEEEMNSDKKEEKKEVEKPSDKIKKDDKKKTDEEKKIPDDKTKLEDSDKKKKSDEKQSDKKSRSGKEESSVKSDDLKQRMNETKRKLDILRTDLDRTQIEVRNLRRRLMGEQKKCKAEEMRAERYRQQMRKLADELKEAKEEFRKETHRLTKKHKLELEKAEFDRESFLKREDDLRRRQEDLSREFKKLEEAKKSFEHLKRSRKSRSMSPPLKRFRGRDAAYPDVSPPPPPKLSGDIRKPLLDRPPSSYYEEKKSRGIYERLGDYADKAFSKESSNGRYRSSYPGEGISSSKSSWSQLPSEPWKKNSTQNTNFLKPYLDRFGGNSYQAQPSSSSSSYYPPGTEYPKHFDSSRKY